MFPLIISIFLFLIPHCMLSFALRFSRPILPISIISLSLYLSLSFSGFDDYIKPFDGSLAPGLVRDDR